MVAKSYQSSPMLGQPFEQAGKMYIMVQLKSGKEKAVRWYSEKEYNKMYPEIKLRENNRHPYGPQKDILGFKNGYITIYTDNMNFEDERFRNSNGTFVYRTLWGWGTESGKEIPECLPPGITPIRLNWEEVGGEDGYLYDDTKVKAAIKRLRQTDCYTLPIGERVTIECTVVVNEAKEDKWGINTLHMFQDSQNHKYLWKTKTRNWSVGMKLLLTGTVKDCNENCIILTRCKGEEI